MTKNTCPMTESPDIETITEHWKTTSENTKNFTKMLSQRKRRRIRRRRKRRSRKRRRTSAFMIKEKNQIYSPAFSNERTEQSILKRTVTVWMKVVKRCKLSVISIRDVRYSMMTIINTAIWYI